MHRKASVAILISDKIDFKITKVTRDKDRHFIMLKGTLDQDQQQQQQQLQQNTS